MFEFVWPWVFILAPLPWIYRSLLAPIKNAESPIRVPFINRESVVASSDGVTRGRRLPFVLMSLAWLALLASAAQPKLTDQPVELPRSGRDLMLAVDISRSMVQPDMIVNRQRFTRIVVVKSILKDFLERRVGDRVGLILFGSQAYLQAPLTFDIPTVTQFLDEAKVGLAGPETAIGDAIGLAIKRLKERPESQRILILLTDGQNSTGIDPVNTIPAAKLAKVKIHTVGVTTSSRSLDEQSLLRIAEQTGGEYYRARSPDELIKIYQKLDEIEAIEQEGEYFRPSRSYYYYPLFVAFILTALSALSTVLPSRNRLGRQHA